VASAPVAGRIHFLLAASEAERQFKEAVQSLDNLLARDRESAQALKALQSQVKQSLEWFAKIPDSSRSEGDRKRMEAVAGLIGQCPRGLGLGSLQALDAIFTGYPAFGPGSRFEAKGADPVPAVPPASIESRARVPQQPSLPVVLEGHPEGSGGAQDPPPFKVAEHRQPVGPDTAGDACQGLGGAPGNRRRLSGVAVQGLSGRGGYQNLEHGVSFAARDRCAGGIGRGRPLAFAPAAGLGRPG